MADAKRCDRCGKYYTEPLNIDFFRYKVLRNSVEQDLCPECKMDLRRFIAGAKVVE